MPGWKSPWTSVSGRPHASRSARRRGRSATNASSASSVPSSSSERTSSRPTSSVAARANAVARQSGNPAAKSSSVRSAKPAWSATSRATISSSCGSFASNRSSPGTSSRSTVCVAGSAASSSGHQVRDGRADHREDRTLVSHEPRHALGPCRGRGGREAQQQREVPRLHLHGRSRARAAERTQASVRPRERRVDAARPRPRHAERIVRTDLAGIDRLEPELRGPITDELGEVRHVAALHPAGRVGRQQPEDHDPDAEALLGGRHDLRDLRPPRFVHRERL